MKLTLPLALLAIVTTLLGLAGLVYMLTTFLDQPAPVASYFELVGHDPYVAGVRPFILRYKPTGQCILIVESYGLTGGPIACPDEDR